MQLVKITIAVTNMQPMVEFYNAVCEANLKPVTAYGMTLYSGKLGGADVLMCPNEIAGVEAKQNRKQLTFAVPDVEQIAVRAVAAGGSIVNRDASAIGVSDPDGNTIEFVQQ